jgi:class 3 adenylate cyclase
MSTSTEERRIVTVLFADMAGSTALGEELLARILPSSGYPS